MNGTKSILDRISNLISSDSKVLKEFNDKINEANKNKNKAEEEKKSFEKEITIIQGDIDEISKASELSERFSNLDSYMPGLEKLGRSVSLLDDLKEELNKIPEQIEKLENNIKNLTKQSDDRTKIIEEADDNLSKLDVEISDAKRYQENLIELVDLAKSGNINKTREEVVETLVHVGFTDKEAVAAAKVVLFPEDDLIPYFNKDNKNEPVVEESSDSEEVKEEIEEPAEEIKTEEENVEEKIDEVINEMSEEESSEDNEVNEEPEDISLDEESTEITLESMDDDETLSPVNVQSDKDLGSIRKMLDDFNFDSSKFSDEDIDVDPDVIRENINFLLDKDIKKEFVYEYPNVLSDKSLKEKYDYIIEIFAKEPEDIKLTPEILASYSKDDLEKLSDVVSQNNIDPRIIPLTVYLKGLQSFLRNYMVLKDNGIELDENELSKFAIVLSINPVDFKKSLQILLDYKLTLKKNDGKIAIMDLAVKDSELANKMDMIINVGEEELIKYYPEVLSGDVKELVNRLIFLKNSEIPYKTQSHNKVIYQSFVLHQDVLDKVLEKHVDLNEVLDKEETNEIVKGLIDSEDVINELNNIDDNFELISNSYNEDYKEIIKLIKGKYTETENAYVIDNYYFSKNKVNRDINYLSSLFNDMDKELIIVASLLHDSRMSKEDMEKVINSLGIKVK